MAIEGGALGLLAYMIQPMFDDVFIAGDRAAVFLVGGAVFAIFIARAVAGLVQNVLTATVARRASAEIQRDLVSHIVALDGDFFQYNSPGVLLERVRGDPAACTNIMSSLFSAFGRDIVAVIGLLSVALSIDWFWTLIAIAAAPILVLPVLLLQKLVRKTSRTVRDTAAVIATRLDEIFHGINTLKLNSTEKYESGRFNTEVDKLVDAELVRSMNAGSVLIDISVDQGGCIETIHPTSYDDPTYIWENIIHFGVTNMPGAVPRTASQVLSAAILPYIQKLTNKNWSQDHLLKSAINVAKNEVIYPALQ